MKGNVEKSLATEGVSLGVLTREYNLPEVDKEPLKKNFPIHPLSLIDIIGKLNLPPVTSRSKTSKPYVIRRVTIYKGGANKTSSSIFYDKCVPTPGCESDYGCCSNYGCCNNFCPGD